MILENKIQCTHCGVVVESKHRHDWRAHTCPDMQAAYGKDAIIDADGGTDYLRRGYTDHRSFKVISVHDDDGVGPS